MSFIAGHNFQLTNTGRRCVTVGFTSGLCNVSWLHVRTATLSDVDKVGFCHQGKLNISEFDGIRAEVAREEKELWEATVAACSAGSV